jgi:hypothetical protein
VAAVEALLEIVHLKEVEQVELEAEEMVNIHRLHQVEEELGLLILVVELVEDMLLVVVAQVVQEL